MVGDVCGPDAHMWELREPVAGHEEPLRIVACVPGPERRRGFACLGYGADGAIVLARRFTDHWAGRFDGTQHGVVFTEKVWRDGVLLWFVHERHGTDHHRVGLSSLRRTLVDASGRTVEMHRWRRE